MYVVRHGGWQQDLRAYRFIWARVNDTPARRIRLTRYQPHMQISTSSVTRCGGRREGGGGIVACIKQSVGSCPCGGRRGREPSAVHSRVCTCPCGAQRFVYEGVEHDSKRHLGFSRVGRIFFHGEAGSRSRFRPLSTTGEGGLFTERSRPVIWYSKFVLFSVFIRIAWAIGGNLKLRNRYPSIPFPHPRLPGMELCNLI